MDSYPLQWPAGWPRTPRPQPSKFKNSSVSITSRCLLDEIRLLKGGLPVLSTNIRLRQDGFPYANDRVPEDKGVAVYFTYKGKPMVFACDKWDKVSDNMQSIRKTIEALRGIERWGASDMMERAFQGFAAIGAPKTSTPWEVLGLQEGSSLEACRKARNAMARLHHPDNGSFPDAELMGKINAAFAEIERMNNV